MVSARSISSSGTEDDFFMNPCVSATRRPSKKYRHRTWCEAKTILNSRILPRTISAYGRGRSGPISSSLASHRISFALALTQIGDISLISQLFSPEISDVYPISRRLARRSSSRTNRDEGTQKRRLKSPESLSSSSLIALKTT